MTKERKTYRKEFKLETLELARTSGKGDSELERELGLSRAVARTDIFEYIELFYNRYRRHSALAYQSPLRFEQLALAA